MINIPILRIFVFLFMVLSLHSSYADDAADNLLRFFAEVKSMRADFVQTITSARGPAGDETSGTLTMQRPGKFLWDYQKPYQQKIIADGKQIWIYDVDLDQVVVKPLDLVLGNTPAVLLSGNATVTQQFKIEKIPAPENASQLQWLRLIPKQDDIGFEKLLLGFDGALLKQMRLTDAFDQVTQLVFSNLEKNPKIDSSIFNFVPPEGVDVIRSGEEQQSEGQ